MNDNEIPFIIYLNNLNRFTKSNCLSEGSFSTVNTVKDISSGNLYCVKSFEFDSSDASKRKIFAKSANKLHSIDFPTLIPHQFFSYVDLSNQSHPSFIYPFYSNKSLKKSISKLDNTQIMIVLIGVAEGLRYLHQNKISHGALEPSNILLDDQFRPILTSYGLDKMIQKFNLIDPQIPNRGSFNYIAPHYSFQQSEEYKTDIYCFGLIVYFLLVKKDPYYDCSKPIHIPAKIVSGSLPQMPLTIPTDFANFMYKCWAQLPHERPNIQEVCKEMMKLRLPGSNIDKINEYRDYLKNEGLNPFSDFKKVNLKSDQINVQSVSDEASGARNKGQAPYAAMQPYKQLQPYQQLKKKEEMQPYTQQMSFPQPQQLIQEIRVDDEEEEIEEVAFNGQNQNKIIDDEHRPRQNVIIHHEDEEEDDDHDVEEVERSETEQSDQENDEQEQDDSEQSEQDNEEADQSEQDQSDQEEHIQVQKQGLQQQVVGQNQQYQSQQIIQHQIIQQPYQSQQYTQQIQYPQQNLLQQQYQQQQLQQQLQHQLQQLHQQIQQQQQQQQQQQYQQQQYQQQQQQPQQHVIQYNQYQQQIQPQQYQQQYQQQSQQQQQQQYSQQQQIQQQYQQQQQQFHPQQQQIIQPQIQTQQQQYQQQQQQPQQQQIQMQQHQLYQQLMIQKIVSSPNFQLYGAKNNFPLSQPKANFHFSPKTRPSVNRSSQPVEVPSLPDNEVIDVSDNENSSSVVEISGNSQGNEDDDDDEGDSKKRKKSLNETSSSANDSDDSDFTYRKRIRKPPPKSPIQPKSRVQKNSAKMNTKANFTNNEGEAIGEEEEYSTDIDVNQFQNVVGGGSNVIVNDSEDEDQNDNKIIKDQIVAQRPYNNNTMASNNEDDFFSKYDIPNDLKKIVKSANQGNPVNQNKLGLYLIKGVEGVFPPNHELAFTYFTEASSKNNVDALFNLGCCYENGTGTSIDMNKAFEMIKKATENGSLIAASYLARYYEEGIGCIVDIKKTAELYKLCYEKNFLISQYARCLLFGIGVECDPQTAFDLVNNYDEASDSGLALVKGMCYEYGLGVEANNQLAIEFYNKAINDGNHQACVNLALLLLSGGVTSFSKQKSPSNFKYISSYDYTVKSPLMNMNDSSSSNLCFDTSFSPELINLGPRTDPIQLLLDASSFSKSAKIILADCYIRGVAIDINISAAIREYKNAANQQSWEGISRYDLLSFRRNNHYISQINTAADAHNDIGLVIYGRLIQKGLLNDYSSLSTEELEDEAMRFFKIASDNGSPIGMCQYGKALLKKQRRTRLIKRINQNDLFEEIESSANNLIDDPLKNQALALIKRSADRKYKGGLYNYGRLLLESLGVIKIDNCDNNIILIKKPSDETKENIQINFNYIDPNFIIEEIDNNPSNINLDQVIVAFGYLRMAADLGNNNSRVLLGLLMKHGSFLNIDINGAVKYFDLARKSESLCALYHYIRMKLKENQNKELSSLLSELKKSTNWKNRTVKYKAINLYGTLLITGEGGIRKSPENAAKFFKKAACYPFTNNSFVNCCPKACINLGDMFNCGVALNKNKSEAIKCYHHALLIDECEINHLNPKAAFQLGMAYFKGKEVRQDLKQSLKLIRFAASKGNAHALSKCASFLMNGIPDVLEVNLSEAFRIFSMLVDQDNEDGLLNAGKMLVEGKGVQINEELGIQLIKRAADKGNNEAQSFLNQKNIIS